MISRNDLWLISADHVPAWLPKAISEPRPKAEHTEDDAGRMFAMMGAGIARIDITDLIAKGLWVEFFGGTSSEFAAMQVKQAAADPEVDGIFIRVDSPGGEVAGTEELANAVHAAAHVKPVHAHIEDLGASAALWVASQASVVTANESAFVGSVGIVAAAMDESEALEQAGLKIHVVSTGRLKGAGADGKVTEAMLEDMQDRVDGLLGVFVGAVARGRGSRLSASNLAHAVSEGSVFNAPVAQSMGLIDSISGRDEAIAGLLDSTGEIRAERVERVRGQRVRRATAIGQARANVKGLESVPDVP